MPKKPGNGPKSTEKALSAIVSDLVFLPDEKMIPVKVKFWHKYSQSAVVDTANVTRELAIKYTDDNRLTRWWSVPGFQEWFLNDDEFRQNTETLAYKALNTLEEILSNPDASDSARVNAAKLALEVADKMPKKYDKVTYRDQKIQEMDEKQLEEFITKRLGGSNGQT